ncbi:MAG: malate dehydrogenase (quinone) [Microbacteriaceae bacterium]|jgi:malate dehydrogenase (quinone)|nr:malate dehydrogenase (quinone) [Microbacteriaceae bacterium]MCI1207098.1 malate dehydrogenase (quinone) [Microbacteriaceae bacterium]
MSATLATFLSRVEPGWRIEILERLDRPAAESSNPWNNAGTGHSALCELNYTPRGDDGRISIDKAVQVNEQFQRSREFWAQLTREGELTPAGFIHPVPHMSFVHGELNTAFLEDRWGALHEHPLFQGMEYSDDRVQINDWAPLLMDGRRGTVPLAATRTPYGADVDFGALTRQLLHSAQCTGVTVSYAQEVTHLTRLDDGSWEVEALSKINGAHLRYTADFVFIGAGGGALPLLQASHIPEGAYYGGFPISGQFLRCTSPAVVARHDAKVYGLASVGAPPMSVPHLDTRIVEGTRSLLFGPYAGWSPRFLQHGSLFDLLGSIHPRNVRPMLTVARDHRDLVRYLVEQVAQTETARISALQQFVPTASADEWELITAGQRVQVIKQVPGQGGVLQFGTELVSSSDGSLAALLGASPGASTAVSIVLDLLARCFPDRQPGWSAELDQLVPTREVSLSDNPELAHRTLQGTAEALGLWI